LTATSFSGSGSSITSVSASNISSGTLSNSYTTATSANTNSAIVSRDAAGNFTASTITATAFSGPLTGNVTGAASLNVLKTGDTMSGALILNASGISLNTVGSVGIGTVAPVSALEVRSASNNSYPVNTGSTPAGLELRLSDSVYGSVLDIGVHGNSPGTQWIQVTDRTNLAAIYPLSIQPNGGNVGIGTTAPGALLDLNSSGTASQAFQGGGDSKFWISETAGTNTLRIGGNGGALPSSGAINIFNNGNVGIGTATPQATLEVAGTTKISGYTAIGTATVGQTISGQTMNLNVSGYAGVGGLRIGGGDINTIYNPAANIGISVESGYNIRLGNTGSNGLTVLASSGNVGIGTTAPNSILDVEGVGNDSDFGSSIQYDITLKAGNGYYRGNSVLISAGAPNGAHFPLYGGVIALMGGNVGIGTTTPNSTLTVQGTVESSTGGFKYPDGHTVSTTPALLQLHGTLPTVSGSAGPMTSVTADTNTLMGSAPTDTGTGATGINVPTAGLYDITVSASRCGGSSAAFQGGIYINGVQKVFLITPGAACDSFTARFAAQLNTSDNISGQFRNDGSSANWYMTVIRLGTVQ
jgi:hypothetical protein